MKTTITLTDEQTAVVYEYRKHLASMGIHEDFKTVFGRILMECKQELITCKRELKIEENKHV